MCVQTKKELSASRKTIRVVVGINLIFTALFVIPLTQRWMDRGLGALRAYNLEKAAGRSLQAWLVASTVGASCLLGYTLWRSWKTTEAGLVIEVTMVLAWWLIVLGVYVFAAMTGMGT